MHSVARLFPLLSGTIAVSDVTLINPDLTVKGQKFEPTAVDSNTVENAKDAPQESAVPPVQIESLNLKGAKITFTPLDGKAMNIEIPALSLQADTLYGPYEFDGTVIYNAMNIAFEGESGAYSKTETMPVNIKVTSDGYSMNFDGIVDTTAAEMSVQGETSVTAKSLSEFGVPLKGALSASGLLTASSSSAKLDNGVVTLGDAKAKLNLTATGLGEGQTKNIKTDIVFSSAIDLDDILGEMKAKAKPESTKTDTTAATKQTYTFLPQTIELPSNMVVNAAITAPAIQYEGQSIKGVSLNASVNGGIIKTSMKAEQLPDGGALNMNATVKAESTSKNGANGSTILANPSLVFDGNITVKSIKALASDWLGVVDAKTFDNAAIPNSLNGTLGGGISGATAKLTAPKLQAGQYNITGLALSYINAATPKFDISIADIDGAAVKVAGTAGNTKEFNVSLSHPNAARAIQIVQPDFKSTPTLTKPMNFNALVNMNDNAIVINNMAAKLGDISTKGTVNVNTSSSKPDIKAELAFGKLDTQALMGGEKSMGTPTSGSSSASKSSGAPWTRDAIDTEFMRTMNIDIKATAETLVHGTWTITNPVLDIALKDGVLSVRDITGGLFGGSVALNGKLSAPAAGQALDVNGSIKASDVDMNKLFKAATAQSKDRVLGQASFNMDVSANGVSSSALVNSLNGDGQINTTELTIKGIDLAKLSEAISDESLTDLKAAIDGISNGGQTVFDPVSSKLTIREGTMPVDKLTLKNATATLTSDGYVSFSRWMMDLKNTILITQPEQLPELVINIKGPLNNPSKNVANDLIRSYVMGKYGAKISDKVDQLLGDKLKDTPVKGLINNFLGVPNRAPTAVEPTPAPSNDNSAPTVSEEPQAAAPAPAPQPAPQPSVEEQAIKGLMNVFGK
jgi:hypothetical protein